MQLVVIEVPGLPPGMTQTRSFDFQTAPDRKIWVIGRQLGSDIHLVDASVSRRHAEAEVRPEGLVIRDLESANGTYINDRMLPGNAPTLMRPGDRLRIGNVVTLLEAGPQKGIYSTTNDWSTAQATMPFDRRQLPLTPSESLLPSQNRPAQPALPVEPAMRPVPRPATPPVESIPPASASASAPVYQQPAPAEAAAYQPPQPLPPRPAEPPAFTNRPEQPAVRPERMPAAMPVYQGPAAHFNLTGEKEPERLPLKPRVDVVPEKRPPVKRTDRPRRGLPWLLILPALLVVLALGGLAYFLTQSKPAVPAVPSVALPANVFSSPAQPENVAGLTLSRPTAWQRSEQGANSVFFARPERPTTVLYLEKAPGRTITSDKLTPQQALAQYVANVRAQAGNMQVAQEPASTTLKDGTPAFLTRLVFSTTAEPKVTDYNLAALSFKCQDSLYFVSAGLEGKDSTPAIRQDLDAALANITCAR